MGKGSAVGRRRLDGEKIPQVVREGDTNWMTAKFKGECVSCTRNIDEGERILYDYEEREARCNKCGEKIKPDPKKQAFS